MTPRSLKGFAVVEESHELFDEDYADDDGWVRLFTRPQAQKFARGQNAKLSTHTNMVTAGCLPDGCAKEVFGISLEFTEGERPSRGHSLFRVRFVAGNTPWAEFDLAENQRLTFAPSFTVIERLESFSVHVRLAEPHAHRRVRVVLHGPWARPVRPEDFAKTEGDVAK